LLTLTADGPGNNHVPVTGSLEAAQSWRTKSAGESSRSPLWGSSCLGLFDTCPCNAAVLRVALA